MAKARSEALRICHITRPQICCDASDTLTGRDVVKSVFEAETMCADEVQAGQDTIVNTL